MIAVHRESVGEQRNLVLIRLLQGGGYPSSITLKRPPARPDLTDDGPPPVPLE